MNILQIIETGGPGGAETIFANLCSGLRDRGHAVSCMIGDGSWLPGELGRRKLETSIIQSGGSVDFALLQHIRSTIRTRNIDIVHAHLFEGSVYASLASRLEGVPCIATLHGQADVGRTGMRSGVKRMIFARLCRTIVTVSNALKTDLRTIISAPDTRFRVIPNGVLRPPARTSGDTARVPMAQTGNRVIAIGNIRVPKDYPNLIDAIAVVRETVPDVHLDILGEPDRDGLFEALELQVKDRALINHVTFHGFVQDPGPILQLASCFVLASTREGFSLATIEAMLSEVPVVATRCGGPEEIIEDGVTGILVPVSNPVALANGIQQVLQNHDRAQQLRSAARHDAEQRYSLDTMVEMYEQLYTSSLATP